MQNAEQTTTRPVRQAKIQAMERIREHTQRQAMLKTAGIPPHDVPKEDEYGLIDTDSEDEDYVDEGSEESEDDTIDEEDEDEDEDEDEEEDEEEGERL
jgi:hypothetical protein